MIILDVIGAGPVDEGLVDSFAVGMAANGAFAGVAFRVRSLLARFEAQGKRGLRIFGAPFLARCLWGLIVVSFHGIFRDTTGWVLSANCVCVRGGRKLMWMKGLGRRRDSVEIRMLRPDNHQSSPAELFLCRVGQLRLQPSSDIPSERRWEDPKHCRENCEGFLLSRG